MKSKAICVALLALVFTARAVPVSIDVATEAASAWVDSVPYMGNEMVRTTVEKSTQHVTEDGARFYMVKFLGKGTVVMSGDTEIEPIVMFTRTPLDLSNIDTNTPFGYALMLDQSLRRKRLLASRQAVAGSVKAAEFAGSVSRNERLWAHLSGRRTLQGGLAGLTPGLAFGVGGDPDDPLLDMRVDELMKSKWGQAEAGGGYCWNYYTPENYVCGCVALAQSQLMRFYHAPVEMGGRGIPFPIADVPKKKFGCSIDGVPKDLEMQGGTYAWTNMPRQIEGEYITTEEQRMNCGKLASDVGISVNMAYTKAGSGSGTGAIRRSLMYTFGYGQAILTGVSVKNGETTASMEDAWFANFNAKCVCPCSLHGNPIGHAVVADGYCFYDKLPYISINFGWGGGSAWFNLPDDLNGWIFTGTIYNVFVEGGVNESGQTTHAIISGRVFDENGEPAGGCTVVARKCNTDDVVATTVSSDTGVWGLTLEGGNGGNGGTYDITAISADGKRLGARNGQSVRLPTTTLEEDGSLSTKGDNRGNTWNCDITLTHPVVRVAGAFYDTLDKAIVAARNAATNTEESVLIELLDECAFDGSLNSKVIDFACTISATNANPYAAQIVRPAKEEGKDPPILTVSGGGRLTLSNVVFAANSEPVVSVAARETPEEDRSSLILAGYTSFGVPDGSVAVTTADEFGLTIAGKIGCQFTLDCQSATKTGDTFCRGVDVSATTVAAMKDAAAKILASFDPSGKTRGAYEDFTTYCRLKWKKGKIPVSESVGYFDCLDEDGIPMTDTAARLDDLFANFKLALDEGRIVGTPKVCIRRSGDLSLPLILPAGLELVGEPSEFGDLPTMRLLFDAGFTVTNGTLAVSGITFADYQGDAVFLVNGPDARLEVGADTVFTGIKGTNFHSGAVAILRGSASLGGGAVFDGCRASGQYAYNKSVSSYGGAVYVGSGCRLELGDCTIVNCSARNYGGGVYAAENATVTLAGKVRIEGNTSGDERLADDICLVNNLKSGQRASFEAVGAIDGSVGVNWTASGNGFGNTDGLLFVTATDAATAHGAYRAFFNDTGAAVVPEVSDNPTGVRWTAAPVGPQPVDPSIASVTVTYAGGGQPLYYYNAAEALEALKGDATIEIFRMDPASDDGRHRFSSDLVIRNKVVIQSDLNEGAFLLERAGDCSIQIVEGGALTLRDVSVYGHVMWADDSGKMWPIIPFSSTTKPLFAVNGGSLTLAAPTVEYRKAKTEVAYAYGATNRNAVAICVWNRGSFAIERGAVVHDCLNEHLGEGDMGRGGALLVDEGAADFRGGVISNCVSGSGGVFIGSKGAVTVSGDATITGNFAPTNEFTFADYFAAMSDDFIVETCVPRNLVVSDTSGLVLTNEFTGRVGYTAGVSKPVVTFGSVSPGYPATGDRQASAHHFVRDADGDIGMVVGDGQVDLLVWSSALKDDGTYVDPSGKVYRLVSGGAFALDVPIPVSGFVYDGTEKVGVPECIGYTLGGTWKAVDAGDYTATATLRPGYCWSDGGTGVQSVPWFIGKAVYDMSHVVFNAVTNEYDDEWHEVTISFVSISVSTGYREKVTITIRPDPEGKLPDGVTVSYVSNKRRNPGKSIATANFTGDAKNYEPIPSMTTEIVIYDGDTPPVPPPPPTPVSARPIAFKSIDQGEDGSWKLVITNRVKWCGYRLLWTDDLKKGFTSTGNWETASAAGAWTTNVVTTDSARFWKAEGKDGEKPAE